MQKYFILLNCISHYKYVSKHNLDMNKKIVSFFFLFDKLCYIAHWRLSETMNIRVVLCFCSIYFFRISKWEEREYSTRNICSITDRRVAELEARCSSVQTDQGAVCTLVFVHTSLCLRVHTYIHAQIFYTMIANGSNIVLGFVALVYLCPFLSVSILSAIWWKIGNKKEERENEARNFLQRSIFRFSIRLFCWSRKVKFGENFIDIRLQISIFRYEYNAICIYKKINMWQIWNDRKENKLVQARDRFLYSLYIYTWKVEMKKTNWRESK